MLLFISSICCFVATFQILEGTIKNTGLRVFLSLLLGAALLASDIFVAIYIGCTVRPHF
jgi:heme/copper-type cytochrome/quinol oxidase subunit 3